MLDRKQLREQCSVVAVKLGERGYVVPEEELMLLEEQRRSIQMELESLQNDRNVKSKAIGQAKMSGEDADQLMSEMKQVGESLNEVEKKFAQVQEKLEHIYAAMPNIAHESVPIGADESENPVLRQWGEPRVFDFEVKDHVDLGENLAGMDFAAGAKLSGARFVVLRGN